MEDYGHEQPEHEADAFRCPQCAGEMNFDAASGQMLCQHCGAQVAVGQSEGQQAIVEYDLEHGLATAAQRGYGTPTRSSQCGECGAKVSFGESETATACVYCGSAQVLQQEESRNVLRPESVVPFHVDKGAASEKFATWIGKLWFRPSNLKEMAKVSEMRGVYVPYWTFDAHVHSDWTAQAGYYYYVTETYTDTDANGNTVTKTRQVRKVRWEPAWGARDDLFDDVLVCASKGLPEELAGKLSTFDTGGLQPYDPAFLAGWTAEEYAVELNDGWRQAVDHMVSVQQQRCSRDVPGDTQRFLNVNNRFSGETFKHVLLPVWISAYRYNEKVYRFLVNGQTGEVTGKAPYSWLKIALLVAFIIAAIVGIVVLVKSGQS